MQRNLNNRVEVLFPIEASEMQHAILERLLKPELRDTINAHELDSDGNYFLVQPHANEESFDSQNWFIDHPLFEVDEEGRVNDTITAMPSGA